MENKNSSESTQETISTNKPSVRKKLNWWVVLLISIGLIIIIFFGLRAFRSFRRLPPPGEAPPMWDVEMIKGWMTIPFVSHSFGVPEEEFFRALNIVPEENRHKSLSALNKELYTGQEGVILEKVKQVIRDWHTAHEKPPEKGKPPDEQKPPKQEKTPEQGNPPEQTITPTQDKP